MSARLDEMHHEQVGMVSLGGFDLRAVVLRSLIYNIVVLLFYSKLGTSVPFFYAASDKT